MSAGDKKVFLLPGQQNLPVRAGGDFLFLKEADRPVRVIVDGQPIVMTPGAKQRITRKVPGQQAFDSFEVSNLSAELPMSVTFVVGEGDYDQNIITGEVITETVLRGAAGRITPDTRQKREIILFPNKMSREVYLEGEVADQKLLEETASITQNYMFDGPNDEIWLAVKPVGGGAYQRDVYRYTREMDSIGFYKSIDVEYQGLSTAYSKLAYIRGIGIVGTRTSDAEVWRLGEYQNQQDVPNKLTDLPGGFGTIGYGICAISESVFAVSGNGNVIVYDFVNSLVLAEIDLTSGTQFPNMSYNAAKNQITVATGSGNRVEAYDATDYTRTYAKASTDWPALLSVGIASKGPFVWGCYDAGPNIDTPTAMTQFAEEDATVPESFYAVEKTQEASAYLNKTKVTASAAVIEIFPTAQGPEVQGEVIRLALESYYGRKVSGEYLDHVYSVRIGKDGAGYPNVNQGGSNRSLAFLGVTDDFSVVVPSAITIEHDSDLQLEGFI